MSNHSPSDAPASPPDAATDLAAWRRRMVALAMKLVWNRDDAEELAQEAFVRATLKHLTPADAAFGPWLMRTVANLCMNHRRRRKTEPLTAATLDLAATRRGHARDEIDRMQELRTAMEHLPEQQRLALVLRGMEGLDYPSIAEIMDLTPAAVRTHVHLARRRLLSECGVRNSDPSGDQECQHAPGVQRT